MRNEPGKLAAVLLSSLLLTACGSQPVSSPGGSGLSQTPGLPADSSCGAQPLGPTPVPTTSAGDPSDPESAVKITGVSRGAPHCAEFEVTNSGKQPAIYTVGFAFLSSSGEALASPKKTVPAVEPDQTVRHTVTTGDLRSGAGDKLRVKITKVRSVPTVEAPSPGGPCPPSGIRVYADEDAEAAMGLRALGIRLENCGTRPTRLNGYPQLQLLDESHKPIRSVKILHDISAISIAPSGADGVAQPLALKPGERAYSVLVWRNTVDAGVNVNSPYVRVWAKPGAAPVMLTPELDLGTTGKLGVGPWRTPAAPAG